MNRTELPDKFCILPFISARVTFGIAVPCCVNHSTVFGESKTTTITDIYSSQNTTLLKFRQSFLQNTLPKSCRACIRAEEHGTSSHRLNSNERWEHILDMIDIDATGSVKLKVSAERQTQPIFFIDGAGGSNRCDLKCRMCHSYASSANRVEEVKHQIPIKVMNIDQSQMPKIDPNNVEISSFNSFDEWRKFLVSNLHTIREIHYDSGEPLINPDTYQTLDLLRKYGRTDVRLVFHSNMLKAKAGKHRFADSIMGFSDVTLNCSMDALREKNYYIRYPSDHDTIFSNLTEIKDKNPYIKLRLAITFQLLNSLSAADLIMFALETGLFEHIALEYLSYPYAYSASSLPAELKTKVTTYWDSHKTEILAKGLPTWHFNELTHCIRMMNAEDTSSHLLTFIEETLDRDRIREQHLPTYFPEFLGMYTQLTSSNI